MNHKYMPREYKSQGEKKHRAATLGRSQHIANDVVEKKNMTKRGCETAKQRGAQGQSGVSLKPSRDKQEANVKTQQHTTHSRRCIETQVPPKSNAES
jgi:hypothetical protein